MMTKDLQLKSMTTFRDKKKFLDKILKLEKKKIESCMSTMFDLHDFILNNWENKKTPFADQGLSFESTIIFKFLQLIIHDRVLPVLYQFRKNPKELDEAIKACVAFTCLWRGYASDGKNR